MPPAGAEIVNTLKITISPIPSVTYRRAADQRWDRPGFSHFCASGSKAYEVRTGLALAELGLLTGQKEYTESASKIADYALSCQQQNGWFAENDLDYHDKPLTHTIAYTLEGLHGIGVLLQRPECIAAVRKTLDRVKDLVQESGFLAGRLDRNWNPAVDWACLTGSAQIAGVCLRMHRDFGDIAYIDAAHRLLRFLCWTQEITDCLINNATLNAKKGAVRIGSRSHEERLGRRALGASS